MPRHAPVCFLLPPEDSAETICERLQDHLECIVDAPVATQLCFLDSFDWRLHQKGLLLLQNGKSLELQKKKTAQIRSTARVSASVKWPGDLPKGELRGSLSEILQMRALLPVVCVHTKSSLLHLRNGDGKTVLRMRVEQSECQAPAAQGAYALLPRLWLLPLKGYENELLKLKRILSGELEQAPTTSLFDEALSAIGRHAFDYSSKLDFTLAPDMTTAQAMRLILLHLLDNLTNNIEGTRADIDTEFLHDLRVATRRTRSALSQIKKILPAAVLEDFKARFAWLGQITSPTRDMDVFKLECENFRELLPPVMREHLTPLHDFFVQQHRNQQRVLKRHLASPRFTSLIGEWRAFLTSDCDLVEGMENADRPVLAVSQERIWKLYRRVLREGRAIDYDSPPEEMHELRKSCKKLRYLMEFFRSLYPDNQIGEMIKELKALLNNLGDYQDHEVQAVKLMSIGEQMKKEGRAPTKTVMAMGVLVAALLERQEQAHKDFSRCFSRFDRDHNHRISRAIFKPAKSNMGSKA